MYINKHKLATFKITAHLLGLLQLFEQIENTLILAKRPGSPEGFRLAQW